MHLFVRHLAAELSLTGHRVLCRLHHVYMSLCLFCSITLTEDILFMDFSCFCLCLRLCISVYFPSVSQSLFLLVAL